MVVSGSRTILRRRCQLLMFAPVQLLEASTHGRVNDVFEFLAEGASIEYKYRCVCSSVLVSMSSLHVSAYGFFELCGNWFSGSRGQLLLSYCELFPASCQCLDVLCMCASPLRVCLVGFLLLSFNGISFHILCTCL